MYDLSIQYHTGFWSYYTVSGGKNAWRFWDAAKFTQGDGIHLNGKGSELKGTLLFNAIENSISLIRNNHIQAKPFEIISDSLIITDVDSIVIDPSLSSTIDINKNNQKAPVEENKIIKNQKKEIKSAFYVVKKNDTLGGIAIKTKIPLSKLKKINHLNSDIIRPGQKLRLK
jgi:LysM repeat protein